MFLNLVMLWWCRPLWGDVWRWLLESEQYRHLVHCPKANDWIVQRALPKHGLQTNGRATASIPRWYVRCSDWQGYVWLNPVRRRLGSECSINAIRDSPCACAQRSLHLRFLWRPAVTHALLPKQWLRLDRFPPSCRQAHHFHFFSGECSAKRRPQLPLGLHYEKVSSSRPMSENYSPLYLEYRWGSGQPWP